MWTIEQLKQCKESEDRVEFKKGEGGNIAYDGGAKTRPADRRRCILGYVVALCNEKGGSLVIGMDDGFPHNVVGTKQNYGAIGELESRIYSDLGIRPCIYELYEYPETKQGRVLVIDVPPRPTGKVFKFEDVPLMRVGEELKPMSDAVYLSIIQEQEPDFSQQICEDATLECLDKEAIRLLREKYAKKQNNPLFLTQSDEQVLSDLGLLREGKVTNAAVILVGNKNFLALRFPQATIALEYRSSEAQIPFDNRVLYCQPFFTLIDALWHDVNLRNGSFSIKEGPYIFNVPYFNEDVIREAVNNAVAHKDYRRTSEIVIKQYPQKLVITNAGGFPLGVTLENILTVPSTPRNRLLTDVLSKTGIVERSGQGIDKIFYNTLSEGKPSPDYTRSDDFKVELSLSAIMQDRAFALFIESVQQGLSDENKLSVFEIIVLDKIRRGVQNPREEKKTIDQLLTRGLIEKRGKTNGISYVLCRSYYEFSGNSAEYFKKSSWNLEQARSLVIPYLLEYKSAKMGDFVKLFEGHLTRKQVRMFVQQMIDENILSSEGKASGTRYRISDAYKKGAGFLGKVISVGLEELKKRGELGNDQKEG